MLSPGLAERLDELFFGSINQDVWGNGIPIGSETGEKRRWSTRGYMIPAGVLKTGRNVLEIRGFSGRAGLQRPFSAGCRAGDIVMMRKEFSIDAEWRSQVPEPVFDERPEYNRLYERTWELAHDHLLDLPGMPQTPYMDEAFCDVRIWIWDSCFMSLFCKYAPNCFPGVETLNNFYLPLYGSGRLPQVIARNAPEWTGATIGEPAEIKICIADNPPLFAWAELQNALMTGDREHLRELLLEKRFLQKHFEWLENLTGPAQRPSGWNRTIAPPPTS